MRAVLSVASEVAPLVKTGGLADVAGALPAALAAEGWAMRTLLPGYPAVLEAARDGREVWREERLFGGPGRVLAFRAAGLDLMALDAPHLYLRDGGPYLGRDGKDWPDNPERFAALSWAGAAIAADGLEDWRPEVMHVHDWQAGLAPLYLKERGGRARSLITIHNVAFHGLADADRRAALRLPEAGFTTEGYEFWGRISALKAGLVWADRISTVSPTYARELLTPEFGMGLDGVLRAREADLAGILNGIDEAAWNPVTDAAIVRYRAPSGKARNRAALCAELGLAPPEGPLCVVVSRLSEQKGLDLLLAALPRLLAAGGALALLGSGDAGLEAMFRQTAAADPARVAVRIGYDEALAHRLIAGGDAILVPSRFEPCGLTQMYGLRYGTLPVVALTGGLADTVITANDAAMKAGVATGLQFHPVTAAALAEALERLAALHADRPAWTVMQRNAMRHPVGWAASAPAYAGLYAELAAA
ncbi:MAG: glycogen synthase GlgA [Rhodobacteraceae bacterium]|nr:glycogen synthase GlgA [Paracoccaceae bacterium]